MSSTKESKHRRAASKTLTVPKAPVEVHTKLSREQEAQLARLAREINEEHLAVNEAVRDSMRHAYMAGKLLLEVKAALPHGEYQPWLTVHCAIPGRTVRLYTRLYRHWDELVAAKGQALATLTLADAAELLALPDTDYEEEMQQLVTAGVLDSADLVGLSRREVAKVVLELAAAYGDFVIDPEHGLVSDRWPDDKRPRITISPRGLRARSYDAIKALREGKISPAQFRQRVRPDLLIPSRGDSRHIGASSGSSSGHMHYQTAWQYYAQAATTFAGLTRALLTKPYGVLQEPLGVDHGDPVLCIPSAGLKKLIADVRAALAQVEHDMSSTP